jgi:hypothetical protein
VGAEEDWSAIGREMGDPPRRRHKQKFEEIEAIVKGEGVLERWRRGRRHSVGWNRRCTLCDTTWMHC